MAGVVFQGKSVKLVALIAGLLASTFVSQSTFAQAKEKPASSSSTAEQAASLDAQAMSTYRSGDYPAALNMFNEVLRMRRESLGETHRDTIASLNNIAFILNALGRSAEAEPIFADALRLRRTVLGPTHIDTLAAMNNYASVLEALGRAAEAEPIFADALRLRRQKLGDNNPDTITSVNNYAHVLSTLGRTAEAEPLYAEALRLRRLMLGERHPETIQSLNNYAATLNELGRPQEAASAFAQVLRLAREEFGEAHPNTIRTMNNYAVVLTDLGRVEEAAPLYADALRLRRQVLGERHPETLVSLNSYAYGLSALDRFTEAEPIFAEALRLRREVLGEAHPDTIQSLNNYAAMLDEIERAQEAEPLYAEALRLRREVQGERHPETIASLNNYASVLHTLGRAPEAEPLFAQALGLNREFLGENHPDTIVSLVNYAEILGELGRNPEAEPIFAQAFLLRQQVLGENHPDTISAAMSLANSRLLLEERPDEALEPARIALRGMTQRSAYLTSSSLANARQSARETSRLQTANQMFASAAWHAGNANQQDLVGLRAQTFASLQISSAGSTSQAIATQAAGRYAAERGLGELISERRTLAESWAEIESRLIAAQAGDASLDAQRRALSEELRAAEVRVSHIDEILNQQAPQYFNIVNQPALDPVSARSIFLENEAALIIVPTDYGTHVMAISSDGLAWNLAALDTQEMSGRVADLRASLEVGPNGELGDFDQQAAHELYLQLIAPMADALAGKTELYIVAGGSLSQLPFGVLVGEAPEGGSSGSTASELRATSWFADEYALVQIPSLQSLAYLRDYAENSSGPAATGSSDGYMGFGDPVLSGSSQTRGARNASIAPIAISGLTNSLASNNGSQLMQPEAIRALSRLTGTKAEVEGVVGALTASSKAMFLGADMTETAMRSADFSNIGILHLATHGLTALESGSLAEPGLVFTPPHSASGQDDGYLSASEVVGLDLGATRWVILSACNTAAPSGTDGAEGFSGLARSFFYAGAPTLLVSHWPVFDDVAARLVVETLRRAEAGESRAQALQSAMRTIREDPSMEAEHPSVWAPFVLVGDGR